MGWVESVDETTAYWVVAGKRQYQLPEATARGHWYWPKIGFFQPPR